MRHRSRVVLWFMRLWSLDEKTSLCLKLTTRDLAKHLLLLHTVGSGRKCSSLKMFFKFTLNQKSTLEAAPFCITDLKCSKTALCRFVISAQSLNTYCTALLFMHYCWVIGEALIEKTSSNTN